MAFDGGSTGFMGVRLDRLQRVSSFTALVLDLGFGVQGSG